MIKERNTNSFSVEKMWIQREIAAFYFHANDRSKFNTIEKITEFLADAKIKSVGYEDVTVDGYSESDFTEGDGSGTIKYLKVYGYRYETDAEQKKRLESEIIRMKHEKLMYVQKANYYTANDLFGSPHDKRLTEFQETVKKL
jgi:hypothetical protein